MLNRFGTATLLAFCTSMLTAQNSSLGQPAMTNTTIGAVPRMVRVNSAFHPTNGGSASPVESVTFRIYSANTGGSPLWQETQNVAIEADGRYSVLLGSTTNEGLPQDLFVSGESRWLSVQFQRAGETERERILMASVPYALKAADADTLGGLPVSAFALNPSASTSGSASVTGAAPTGIGGTSKASALAPRFASSGTMNFIPVFTDNAGDIGNSVIYQSPSGRIGVGTMNPNDIVQVAFSDTIGGVTGFGAQNLSSGPTSFAGLQVYDQNSTISSFAGFNNSTHEFRINNIATNGTINLMIGSSPKVTVRNDGDVDIPGSIRKNGSLFLHNIGTQNTAGGLNALSVNTGSSNTAFGYQALKSNASTGFSVAIGTSALSGFNSTTVGDGFNVAIGTYSMLGMTSGFSNVAVGHATMISSTSATYNTALGYADLASLTTGSANTAVGPTALHEVTTGNTNIGIGSAGGYSLTTGSNNIDIGNNGTASDSGIIRIGAFGSQTAFFAAGIHGVTPAGADVRMVVIDSNGQLGTSTGPIIAAVQPVPSETSANLAQTSTELEVQRATIRQQADRIQSLERRLAAIETMLSGR